MPQDRSHGAQDDLTRAQEITARRWLGLFFALAAIAALLNAVIPGYGGFDVAGLAALGAASAVVSVLLLASRTPLPRPLVHLALIAGSAAIALSIDLTQGVPNDSTYFYLWIALFAFYFLPARAAWGHVAVIGASFAVAIALQPPPYPAYGHWATVLGATAAAGFFVGRLKTRLDGHVDRFAGLAHTDELTGLPNRRAWTLQAAQERNRAIRTEQPLAVALLDLDGFKRFNDRHGHAAGDALLAEAAAVWRDCLRDFDFIARIGGDEFAVLLPGCDAAAADEAARRLGRDLPSAVTCSVGTAQMATDEALEDTLARADAALYAVKSGRAVAPTG